MKCLFSEKGRGFNKAASLILYVSIIFMIPGISFAAEKDGVENLLAMAESLKLYQDPYWESLLHYKKNVFGSRSLVDDPGFFLNDNGKYDARTEMMFTIRAMFAPEEKGVEHVLSRFPARCSWLVDRLNIDKDSLPDIEYNRFEEVFNRMSPQSISIVFPAGYLSSPASMYGHTFLVVHTSEASPLLSYAINYAAATDESFGPIFALRGLFGLYRGYFSVMPYYLKVSEYSDMDHRDMWEYPLLLDPDDVKRLLMHLYELDSRYTDYYFLDENCSYSLLFLVEASRPGISLTDEFPLTCEPIDTIRFQLQKGIVSNPLYRPSRVSKVMFIYNRLSEKEQDIGIALAKGTLKPDVCLVGVDEDRASLILDFSIEYLQYLRSSLKIGKRGYQRLSISLMRARSGYGRQSDVFSEIPVPDRPDKSHKSYRVALFGGHDPMGMFGEIAIRPTCHGIMDNDFGLVPGSEIVFGNLILRYYNDGRKPVLQRFDLLDVLSLPESNRLFIQRCWRTIAGVKQYMGTDESNHLSAFFEGGTGFATLVPYLGRLYCIGQVDFLGGSGFEQYYAAGVGPMVGCITSFGNYGKVRCEGFASYFVSGQPYYELGALAEVAIFPSINTSINSSVKMQYRESYSSIEYKIGAQLFF